MVTADLERRPRRLDAREEDEAGGIRVAVLRRRASHGRLVIRRVIDGGDGDDVRALLQVRTQVGEVRRGPVLAGDDLRSVHVKRVAVVAGRDGPRFLRRFGKHDCLAQIKRLGLALRSRVRLAPDPFHRGRQRVRLDFRRAGHGEVDAFRRLRIPNAGERAEGIAELLGAHAAHGGPVENEARLLLFIETDGGELIRARREDKLHRALEVVAIRREVRGEPVEHVLVPRGLLHLVHRLDESVAEELRPEPVDDRAGETSVLRLRDDLGKTLRALGLWHLRGDLPQLGEDEARARLLPGWLVALEHLQRLVGIDVRQRVGIGERPVVDEAVVAARAFEVHAHEDLRNVLRGLHRRNLAGVHCAAPDDAFREPGGLRRWIDQLRDKLVVRLVLVERGVEPRGNLLAPTVDVARALVIISQQVVPERQPMLGVTAVVGEQTRDKLLAFVSALVAEELLDLLRRREQADDVEIDAAGEGAVIDRLAGLDLMLGEVRREQAVDGILQATLDRRQLDDARMQVHRRLLGEVNRVIPLHPLINPRAQQSDLRGG